MGSWCSVIVSVRSFVSLSCVVFFSRSFLGDQDKGFLSFTAVQLVPELVKSWE